MSPHTRQPCLQSVHANKKGVPKKSPLLSVTLRFAAGNLRWVRFEGVRRELAALKHPPAYSPQNAPTAGTDRRGRAGSGYRVTYPLSRVRERVRVRVGLTFGMPTATLTPTLSRVRERE